MLQKLEAAKGAVSVRRDQKDLKTLFEESAMIAILRSGSATLN
jgi:hypothetical protein